MHRTGLMASIVGERETVYSGKEGNSEGILGLRDAIRERERNIVFRS